jgi:hypothetical protein
LTPRTARARSAAICFTVPPNTGGRATSATSMPGTDASSPKVALPVTFARLSRRRVGLPMILNCDGSLRATSGGTGTVRALSTSCP